MIASRTLAHKRKLPSATHVVVDLYVQYSQLMNHSLRRCHPYARKSALQAVVSGLKLTLQATRRTPHGASCLVLAMSAWSVKNRRAASRHCRDARVYVIRLRPCMTPSSPPPRKRTHQHPAFHLSHLAGGWCTWNRVRSSAQRSNARWGTSRRGCVSRGHRRRAGAV